MSKQPTQIALDYVAQIGPKFVDMHRERSRKFSGDPRLLADDTYEVEGGQKFDRIVVQHQAWPYENGAVDRTRTVAGQRMVHAFVDRATGALYKAAGWSSPAKDKTGKPDARFDLSTPSGFEEAVKAADPYGSYLYKR